MLQTIRLTESRFAGDLEKNRVRTRIGLSEILTNRLDSTSGLILRRTEVACLSLPEIEGSESK